MAGKAGVDGLSGGVAFQRNVFIAVWNSPAFRHASDDASKSGRIRDWDNEPPREFAGPSIYQTRADQPGMDWSQEVRQAVRTPCVCDQPARRSPVDCGVNILLPK